MVSSEVKPVWQHLRQGDGGTVVIHANDGDRFALPIDDVVRACKSRENVTQFCKQFGSLLGKLADWLDDRQTQIEAAFLGLEPEGAILVVVRKDKAFDPDFEDGLSILDLDVAQDDAFSLIKLRVLALPLSANGTVASFMQLERAFSYGGNREAMPV